MTTIQTLHLRVDLLHYILLLIMETMVLPNFSSPKALMSTILLKYDNKLLLINDSYNILESYFCLHGLDLFKLIN